MSRFIASTLTETAATEDKRRFEMTFVDAAGRRSTISIPSALAADLIPVLQQVAAAQMPMMGELTRLPRACVVGSAIRERKVLLRFDDEPPYAISLEAAAVLSRDLQEESEAVSKRERPALH
jgi:hypothetical protein